MKLTKLLLLLPLTAVLSLSSCVDAGYAVGSYGNGYNSYATLPLDFSGNAYLYNGRYYSGGLYQTGRYNNLGRNYDSRYFHNGQYYYGGNHAHYQGDGHNHGLQRNAGSTRATSRMPYRPF